MNPPVGSRGSLRAIVRASYWRAEEARVVLEAWRGSGLTRAAFAGRYGLREGRLTWWRQRLEEPGGPQFHPVQLVETPAALPVAASVATAIEIIPGSPRRVVVRSGFDAEHLAAVLAVLERRGC